MQINNYTIHIYICHTSLRTVDKAVNTMIRKEQETAW